MWGGPQKKKSCSEFAETCSCFGNFEIRKKKISGGGGGGGDGCSECAETCSHFGIFEILQKKCFEVKKFNRQTDTIVTR